MIRMAYLGLLWLHPPAFRREFADEMLWIFDETSGAAAVWLLFGDALVSLGRQWLLRSGAWKLLAAGAGGLVQIMAGGLGLVLFHQVRSAHHFVHEPRADAADMTKLIYLAVGVVGGVVSSVLALTLWVRNFAERRIHHDA
jgi:hypothetical protein